MAKYYIRRALHSGVGPPPSDTISASMTTKKAAAWATQVDNEENGTGEAGLAPLPAAFAVEETLYPSLGDAAKVVESKADKKKKQAKNKMSLADFNRQASLYLHDLARAAAASSRSISALPRVSLRHPNKQFLAFHRHRCNGCSEASVSRCATQRPQSRWPTWRCLGAVWDRGVPPHRRASSRSGLRGRVLRRRRRR